MGIQQIEREHDMKAIVVTTITSTIDLETFDTSHSVDIADEDGLSEVSPDALGALLIGALSSTTRAVRKEFPRAARIEDKQSEETV